MSCRDIITLLSGAVFGWPASAKSQKSDGTRRIGVLSGIAANDPDVPLRVSAFSQGLNELGWIEGRNVVVEYRWAAGDLNRMGVFAKELVDFQSDVIVAQSTPSVAALRRETKTMPIVFVNVADPVGSGMVASLARPGGNVTGFTNFEPAMGSKWLQLLKEAAPAVDRVAALFNPRTTPYAVFLGAVQAAAPTFGIRLIATPVQSTKELEIALEDLATQPNAGIVALPDTFLSAHRELLIGLAARHRLPAIYPFRYFATSGGLLSYGVETVRVYRKAASYVDRILRGVNPIDLPVQAPTAFELVINLKTAKTLGLTVSPITLARADEVIE